MQKKQLIAAILIMNLMFSAKAQHTLTDADVTLCNGVIESCSYNF
jgi:hypothetical protein